jgi:hypothetical protein
MVLPIVLAVVFLAAGITLIIKRAAAAHGFSLVMGGTTPPFIMTMLGGFFIALAGATVYLYASGMLGHR